MRIVAVLPLLLCVGCVKRVSVETYEVPSASSDATLTAARAAAERLGLTVAPSPADHVEVTDALSPEGGVFYRVELHAPEPGRLEVWGPQPTTLRPMASVLVAGTTQELAPVAHTTRLEPRSAVLAAGLDLVLPIAGRLYVDSGDPYARSWGPYVIAVGYDLMGGLLLGTSPLLARDDPSMARMFLVLGVATLVVNRLFSAAFDIRKVLRRNDAVASGYELGQVPEPIGLELNRFLPE